MIQIVSFISKVSTFFLMSNFLYIILYIKRAGVTYCYKKNNSIRTRTYIFNFFGLERSLFVWRFILFKFINNS